MMGSEKDERGVRVGVEGKESDGEFRDTVCAEGYIKRRSAIES